MPSVCENLPITLTFADEIDYEKEIFVVEGEYNPRTQKWSHPTVAGRTTWCQTSTTGKTKGSDPDDERDDET